MKRLKRWYFAMFVGLVPACNIMSVVLSSALSAESATAVPQQRSWLWMVFGVTLLPAIYEELLFRRILQRLLYPLGAPIAIVLSSVMFTWLHVGSLIDRAAIFILSFALGVSYLLFNDIKYTVALHLFNNVFALCVLIAATFTSGLLTNILVISLYALCVVFSVLYLLLGKQICLKQTSTLWQKRCGLLKRL